MKNESNRIEPAAFTEHLEKASSALWDLLGLCREVDCRVKSSTNAHPVDPDLITPFHVANQYARPTEFLQTLLDMFRVTYEPVFVGTFFLNGNLGFLLDALPDGPFRLGYATLTGDADQPFEEFWEETVLPYLSDCGYAYETALAVFGVVSNEIKRVGVPLLESVLNVVGAGLSPEEVLGIMAAGVEGREAPRTKTVHFGFCFDPALESKRRLLLWLALPLTGDAMQH